MHLNKYILLQLIHQLNTITKQPTYSFKIHLLANNSSTNSNSSNNNKSQSKIIRNSIMARMEYPYLLLTTFYAYFHLYISLYIIFFFILNLFFRATIFFIEINRDGGSIRSDAMWITIMYKVHIREHQPSHTMHHLFHVVLRLFENITIL